MFDYKPIHQYRSSDTTSPSKKNVKITLQTAWFEATFPELYERFSGATLLQGSNIGFEFNGKYTIP
jgi:hypothetical protein